MTDENEGRWVIFDGCAAGAVVNPLNSHYENAVRHLEEIFRTKPPLNHDLLGAPHSCAEAIENVFGRIRRRGGAHKRQGWPIAELKSLGVGVGAKAEELLSSLRRMWNQDKHGAREGDAVEAFRTATPEFAVDAVNLTGALLAAFFYKSDGSRARWIRLARVTAGTLELRPASDADQGEMMAAWAISVDGF